MAEWACAELLDEHGDVLPAALGDDAAHGAGVAVAGARPALTSDQHPVDPRQVDVSEVYEQRLDGQEADGHGDGAEDVDAGQAVLAILDANAEPHVLVRERVHEPRRIPHVLGALREDHEEVLLGLVHHAVATAQEVSRHAVLMQVAHAVHEVRPRLGGAQRLVQLLRHEAQVEALVVRVRLAVRHDDPTPALGERFRVAVLAPR